MTKKKDRADIIHQAIELVWDSLSSHLEWTHEKSSEGQKFHQDCVKEYSELLVLLTKLF